MGVRAHRVHTARWVALAALLVVSPPLFAQRNLSPAPNERLALVIGNDNYVQVRKLANARADARAMARSLEQSGFNVTLRLDLGRADLLEAVRSFKSRLTGGSEAVFYFAGHGVQLGAANYLLPVDIVANNEEQVRDDGLPLQRILDDLTDQKARFSLAIIDACRDNPFPRTGGRSIGTGRGLAPTTAATGQMVLYSAGAGQTALDRLGEADKSQNGVFTRVFLQEMQKPGVPVDQVLRNVRDEVVRLAKSVGHSQVPALYDQAIGTFFFRPGAPAVVARPADVSRPVSVDPLQVEMLFWDSIKSSSNRADFEEYLRLYPDGQFAGLAQNRLKSSAPSAVMAAVVAPAVPAPAPATLPGAASGLSGSLRVGQESTHTLELAPGVRYTMRGVCDSACTDLDLFLNEGSGGNSEVAKDVAVNATPSIYYLSSRPGSYRLKVKMVTCKQEPCSYSVTIVQAAVAPAPANALPAPLQGSLAKGANGTHTLMLTQDLAYWIRGSCDADCKDMDLYLLDPSGNEIVKDAAPNATPSLYFAPPASGQYTLRVAMYDCTAAPCAYTVRFGGEAPAPIALPATLQGSLANSATRSHTISLAQGARYSIRGTCDADCKDLDLFLADPRGSEIAKDDTASPTPNFVFTAPISGEYALRVRMYSCTAAPCAYTVNIDQ